jgi:hypothetical protein
MTRTLTDTFWRAGAVAPIVAALSLGSAADVLARQASRSIGHGGAFQLASGRVAAREAQESARMTRAKDLISEDRWVAAIAELRAAVADSREEKKDEALFWLAHSQNQAGDLAEAVESIRRLQREYTKSRWTAPAYSLLIELAQKLGREDVLWRMAPPTPPPPPAGPTPPAVARPSAVPAPPGRAPVPPPAAPVPASPRAEALEAALPQPPPPRPAPPVSWVAETYRPDPDLRVEALGRLLHTDAEKVIPLLGNIALEGTDPGAARRAVFVLAASRKPEAQSVVVDVARHGPQQVRIAAVRELARFGGDGISRELLDVYSTAELPVKQQVVLSLGERAETDALFRIAQAERNVTLRETAIITLGRAGGRQQLRGLYPKASASLRRAIVRGLFSARDDEGLIRLAGQEKDPGVRAEILAHLRLMGTPKSRAYLEKLK